MNWDQIPGKWKQFKGGVREKWGKHERQSDIITGKRDQLLGVIQEKYGITKEAAEQELKEWEATHKGPDLDWPGLFTNKALNKDGNGKG